MDIAALSMSMSMERTAQAVSLAMVKKTMEQSENSFLNLIEGLSDVSYKQPPSDHILDVRA